MKKELIELYETIVKQAHIIHATEVTILMIHKI